MARTSNHAYVRNKNNVYNISNYFNVTKDDDDIRTTIGDNLLSGVNRTGILVLLITVRKLHPSDDSARK